MGIRIDGGADLINATDGSLTVEGQSMNYSGIITASGLVTADKIIHDGDTNTAIRFPGADQFSVETAGSQRFHIGSDGDALFQATGDNAQFTFKKADAPDGEETVFVDFDRNGTVIGGVGGAAQVSGASGGDMMLAAVNSNNLLLGTGSSSIATERLRITSAGRVGIGTDNPGTRDTSGSLDVYANLANNGPYFRVLNTNATYGGGFQQANNNAVGGVQFLNASGTNVASLYNSTGGWTWDQNLQITSTNGLRIGQTASYNVYAASVLQVSATDSAAAGSFTRWSANAYGPYLNFGKSRSGTVGTYTVVQDGDALGTINFAAADGTDLESVGAAIVAEVDGSPGGNDTPGRLVFETTADGAASATERLRIDKNGYLGMCGYGAPDTALSIKLTGQATDGTDDASDWGGAGIVNMYNTDGGTASSEILLLGSQTSGVGQISSGFGFGRHNTSDWGTFISFKTHGANTSNIDEIVERVRIASDGNTTFGGVTFQYPKRVNIQGSSGSVLALRNWDTTSYAQDTSTAIDFNLKTGNTGNQDGSCEIRAFKENGTNGDNARGLNFWTAGNGGSPAERMRIHSGGVVSIPGGIEFGSGVDNTAANVMEDYEEGTFTLTLTDASGNNATSGGTGHYTKIGRWVNCWGQITFGDASTSVGGNACAVKGWPFAVGSHSSNDIPVWVWSNGTDIYEDGYPSVSTDSSGTVWPLYIHKYNGAPNITGNDMGNGSRISLGFSYEAT